MSLHSSDIEWPVSLRLVVISLSAFTTLSSVYPDSVLQLHGRWRSTEAYRPRTGDSEDCDAGSATAGRRRTAGKVWARIRTPAARVHNQRRGGCWRAAFDGLASTEQILPKPV